MNRHGNRNFWNDIKAETKDEPIDAVVIGQHELRRNVPSNMENILLTEEEAQEYLSYDYHDGYGSPDCHAVFVWTPNRVIFVSTYDGATWISSVPRNPTDGVIPEMYGG